MNNEKEVRNFYEEEAAYEKSILITKQLVEKVISIDFNILQNKIKAVDKENKYNEFIDLLIAVTGRRTNKYYYCMNEEDTKYYNLEVGKVYKMSEVGPEIQSKNSIEKVLDLQARAQLVPVLLMQTKELKDTFNLNINNEAGILSTIDSDIISSKDIEYLNDLIKYLELMNDKTGRLKILVAERDVYSLMEAKKQYNNKSSLKKMFYKIFIGEKTAIENLAKKSR